MKYLFTTGQLYIGSNSWGVTNFQVSESVGEIDLTDTDSGGYKEYGAGIKGFGVSIDLFRDNDDADLVAGTLYENVIIDFGENMYYGDLYIFSIQETGKIDDAVKLSIGAKFSGATYKLFEQLMVNSNGFDQTSWDGTGTPNNWSVVGSYEDLSLGSDIDGDYVYMEIVDQTGCSFEQTFASALTNGATYLNKFKYSDASFDAGAELTVQLEGTQDDVILTLDNGDAADGTLFNLTTTTSASTKFVIKDSDAGEAYWLNIRSIDLYKAES